MKTLKSVKKEEIDDSHKFISKQIASDLKQDVKSEKEDQRDEKKKLKS